MKFLKTVYYIFLGCIVIVAILLLVSVFPVTGNIKVLTVLSGSMEPAIHTGSVVVIKPMVNYKVGDVITFGPNTKIQIPTTHRIVEIRAQEGQTIYKTRGDANNAEDMKEVLAKDVIGKVVFDIPYFGYIVEFIRKPIGLLLVVVLPAIFIVYDEVKKIMKEIKKIKKEKASDNMG
jgi:signal peptidase